MRRVLDFLVSDLTVMVVILINAVSLTALASTSAAATSSVFANVDIACVLFFVFEAVVKTTRHGWSKYWADSWNRFDFIVLLLSLPALATVFGVLSTKAFSVFLLLRVGRLFRLFRLLRFVPNKDHLAIGLKRALKASLGVLIAVLIINFIFALGASLLFGQYVPEHFGDPLTAMYSTFSVFTVEGWNVFPELIAQRADNSVMLVLARVYFVVAVLVVGILGLSLANAVFVDEMTMDNTKTLEDKIDQIGSELSRIRAQLERQE